MNLTDLIRHPEQMNRETLFDLRNITALHPYYQTARILLLQNLYLLHDPTFDEELRRAAMYITDRKVLFSLFEAAHYKFKSMPKSHGQKTDAEGKATENRTAELIDSFLESVPKDSEEEGNDKPKRKPTAADAAVDYVAYLLECGNDEEEPAPQMKGQSLIDDFLVRDKGRIILPETTEEPQERPAQQKSEETNASEDSKPADEGVYTETLAKIYIKQGRYSQALEIIKRLNLDNPKKNSYFADQIRFLEKLVANSNCSKRKA